MANQLEFDDIARLPAPEDNVAIAVQHIDSGTIIRQGDQSWTIPTTVMEGHRFAVRPIQAGEPLLSWNLPFGIALTNITPGEYVFNQGVIDALSTRKLSFDLPSTPNFRDAIEPYTLRKEEFTPAEPTPVYETERTFQGYRRSTARGVGTRNFIVLLGTTSLTGSFVRQLEERLKGASADYPNIDGIVAVAHTEGAEEPNNAEFVLRTLAGFVVHPNVGAVLCVDYGSEPINNAMLRAYMQDNNYPLEEVPHAFFSLLHGFLDDLETAEELVRKWLPDVNADERTEQSLAHMRIAMQCGGSDAFSGISGNPLTAWVAREVIRYGGGANLAETDELIGAEPYILQKVRDWTTAQQFLDHIASFKERVGWHGHTAEGNPTGGNKYRGLYNINLKSIGAARKKNPDVRLDYVIDYAERIQHPGYHFMNSPGNDIESIAGQVASGCNLITFVTGNGSVTNFPFVPTLKVVTTTKRYNLLRHDMDVNAGAYLDGVPMDTLGEEMFDLALAVASGQESVGEKAGHSQVQLWRNWRQTDSSRVEDLLSLPKPSGKPLSTLPAPTNTPDVKLSLLRSDRGTAHSKIGLIIPTSLCSSEVAKIAAARLNESSNSTDENFSEFVALSTTEGCGNSSGVSEELYARTLLGYALHPMAEHTLFLEHGCEKTHNDYMQAMLSRSGISTDNFGWASIQMDGGIEASLRKVSTWFEDEIESSNQPLTVQGGLADMRIGFGGMEPVSDALASGLALVTQLICDAGGLVVVPQNAPLLSNERFVSTILGDQSQTPTVAYGQHTDVYGFHIMEAPTGHWVETLTGLAATGVEVVVAPITYQPLQTHPLAPVLQITDRDPNMAGNQNDIDLLLSGDGEAMATKLLHSIAEVYSGQYVPKLHRMGNVDFQITRGLLGVTM